MLLVAPRFINTCAQASSLATIATFLLHHPLDIFLFWSPLFLMTRVEYIIHAIVSLGVILHWVTYNSRCVVTVLMNRMCGWPEGIRLDSLKNMILGKYERYNYLWLIAMVLYDVWVILR